MENQDRTPEVEKKSNKDFIWFGIGMVGFIAAMVLLKVIMQYFGLIG